MSKHSTGLDILCRHGQTMRRREQAFYVTGLHHFAPLTDCTTRQIWVPKSWIIGQDRPAPTNTLRALARQLAALLIQTREYFVDETGQQLFQSTTQHLSILTSALERGDVQSMRATIPLFQQDLHRLRIYYAELIRTGRLTANAFDQIQPAIDQGVWSVVFEHPFDDLPDIPGNWMTTLAIVAVALVAGAVILIKVF